MKKQQSYFILTALLYCFLAPGVTLAQPSIIEENNYNNSNLPLMQRQVEDDINKRLNIYKDSVIDQANTSLKETQNALDLLYENKPQEAKNELEKSINKLNIVLAKYPNLILAPVEVSITAYDVFSPPYALSSIIRQAKASLKQGKLQSTRALICTLASEVTVYVTHIPLGTYPEAIQSVIKLIDNNQLKEAKIKLQIALNTLVVKAHVFPLPYIRSLQSLDIVKEINELKIQSDQHMQSILSLLNYIRAQLQLAEVLGYASYRTHKPIYKQLDEIEIRAKRREIALTEIANAQHFLSHLINH